MAPDVHRLIGQHENAAGRGEACRVKSMCTSVGGGGVALAEQDVPPPDAQFGGQVGPVAVGDVGVLLEEERDLLVRVEPDPLGQQHRPVVVAAQLHVVRRPQQLLGHFQQHVELVGRLPPAPS